MKKCQCSRREFLINGTKSLAILGVATFFVSPKEIWAENSKDEPNLLKVDISKKENEKLKIIGGSIFVKNPTNNKEEIIIYRESEELVKAFKNYCTHKGGPLKTPNKDGLMVCKWHKAKFDIDGEVKKGPAKEKLKIYEVKIEENIITVIL